MWSVSLWLEAVETKNQGPMTGCDITEEVVSRPDIAYVCSNGKEV